MISRNDIAQTVEDIDGTQVEVIPQRATSYGQATGLFGVNCKHYPMTFILGFSALRGEPQDPEENAKAYAQSQEQRRLERRLREEKRDLAVMRAQGAPDEHIRIQRERVQRASDRIDEFCDQTGLPRRRNREYTPVNATWPDTDDIPPRTGGSGSSGPDTPPVQMRLEPGNFPPVAQTQDLMPEALTPTDSSDTIPVSTQAVGDDVREIATIQNQAVIDHWGKVDTNVVLTDERIAHIREGHEEDYLAYGDRITETIERPDYILDDAKNHATALFVKRIEQSNLNVVVRLKIEGSDADDLRSSVITMYRLGDKTLKRLLKKNELLYTKPDI